MDWWQGASLMATFVATSAAVATFGWRIAERMRLENREAHDRIGARIDEVEERLGARIDGVGRETRSPH